jgi:hypothetical protein
MKTLNDDDHRRVHDRNRQKISVAYILTENPHLQFSVPRITTNEAR